MNRLNTVGNTQAGVIPYQLPAVSHHLIFFLFNPMPLGRPKISKILKINKFPLDACSMVPLSGKPSTEVPQNASLHSTKHLKITKVFQKNTKEKTKKFNFEFSLFVFILKMFSGMRLYSLSPNLSFDTLIGIVIHYICQMTYLSFISKMAYLT